jgi:hypothetical protein
MVQRKQSFWGWLKTNPKERERFRKQFPDFPIYFSAFALLVNAVMLVIKMLLA